MRLKLFGIMFRSAAAGAAVLGLVACDPYSGFGAVCTEGHPAVQRARSLSEDQLAFLYSEVYRLRRENGPMGAEYGTSGEAVPKNLEFLQAARIHPSDVSPNIMLAGRMNEYIYLRFSDPDSDEPGIVLTWAAGTREEPYRIGEQVLWRPPGGDAAQPGVPSP